MTAVCVIGDIFDDYVADLAPDPRVIRSIVSGSGYDVPSSIAHVVGGAGIQFAVAAAKLGAASTTLIGKVGGARSLDSSAERAEAYMDEAGIRSILAIDQSTHTGRAIVSYLPQGRRLMISDVGANATFCSDDLTDTMYDAVSSSDLLYVSGFSLV